MNGAPDADRLYNLLPYVYRLRDAERGEPLRALMAVMQSQLDAIEADVSGLYDNWFIETCAEWVVPYIADLLKARGLYVYSPGVFSLRPYVANTLGYRRRKGTVAVLEQLARDVTGWPARAVEFFQGLATTQNVNHLRATALRTPDLRDTNSLELLGGPFEQVAYTADVRSVALGEGKYNIANVGISLWRLQSYPLRPNDPAAAWAVDTPAAGRFTFNPIGLQAPLFNVPRSAGAAGGRPGERDVPGALRRRALYDELEARRAALTSGSTPQAVYFADNPVFTIQAGGQTLAPEEIQICNLDGWDAPGWQPPASQTFHRPDGTSFITQVAADPQLGRLAFLKGVAPKPLATSHAWGFSGDLGGGPYDRRRSAAPASDGAPAPPDTVADPNALDALIRVPSGAVQTIAQALAQWDQHANLRAVIQIEDSRTYTENVAITLAGGVELVIQAANERRPVIVGDVTISKGSGGERVALSGLLIAGQVQVNDALGELAIEHSTLAPGWSLSGGQPVVSERPSLVVAPGADALALSLDHAVSGPLRLPAAMASLAVTDSIVASPLARGQATRTPALLSGDLGTFPALSSAAPSLAVTIGGDGPYILALSPKPTTLGAARAALEAALRAASSSPAFANARVAIVGNRLAVLPGVAAAPVMSAPAGGDPTVSELRLDAASAQQVSAVVSGALSPFAQLNAPATLDVTIGAEGPFALALKPRPTTLAQARTRLESALRAAAPSAAFTGAGVGLLDDRMVVVPGAPNVAVVFRADPADASTIQRLALDTGRPAVAADDAAVQPGPPASFVRATVMGEVHVREIALGSDAIFADPVQVERRQSGCLRFSYVSSDRSTTPRRYRCQPDLALKDAGAAEEAAIRLRVSPDFTSTAYGDPAFAQLSRRCAAEITAGAEDGSEMGAFSFLKQPQREANLLATLGDYLRFGLDAGLFYLT